MLIKEKTVCFSGHRSEKLPKTSEKYEDLKVKIYEEIEKAVKDGFSTFIIGGCYGFDLLCAEIVILYKMVTNIKEPKNITLIAAIPFEEQATKWREEDREQYFRILEKCDEVIYINKKYSEDCYRVRNNFMVDNSSRLICYYDGSRSGTGHTVNYAMQNNRKIVNLFK